MQGINMFILALTIFQIYTRYSKAQSTETLVPAIFTFGDSMMDVGNNNHLSADFKANYQPYGRDFKNHRPNGRFCNGKLPIDITAETLGFKTYPLPYLSPLASGKNLLIGTSFASAGSGYYDRTANLYHALTLSQQLKYYTEYQSKLVQLVGQREANSILRGALYVLGTGPGDFVQNYYINPDLSKLYSIDEFSNLLLEELSKFVTNLYDLGARKIGVTSMAPLGCLPAMITFFGQDHENPCVTQFNQDAQTFNGKLNYTIHSLAKRYNELKIAVFDIYQPLYDLITAPSKQGFVETHRGCCVTGTTARTSVLCKPEIEGMCSNATKYVFWDSVHPSEAANRVIADSLLIDGLQLV